MLAEHGKDATMEVQAQTQFSVYLINKPGVLAAVTGALAEANVNIIALALMDAGEHGALRLVCNDARKARQVLSETHDRWTEAEVLTTVVPNEPGAFAAIARLLADADININYAYLSGGPVGGPTTAVLRVADAEKATELLTAT